MSISAVSESFIHFNNVCNVEDNCYIAVGANGEPQIKFKILEPTVDYLSRINPWSDETARVAASIEAYYKKHLKDKFARLQPIQIRTLLKDLILVAERFQKVDGIKHNFTGYFNEVLNAQQEAATAAMNAQVQAVQMAANANLVATKKEADAQLAAVEAKLKKDVAILCTKLTTARQELTTARQQTEKERETSKQKVWLVEDDNWKYYASQREVMRNLKTLNARLTAEVVDLKAKIAYLTKRLDTIHQELELAKFYVYQDLVNAREKNLKYESQIKELSAELLHLQEQSKSSNPQNCKTATKIDLKHNM